jgi:hypothetical protein
MVIAAVAAGAAVASAGSSIYGASQAGKGAKDAANLQQQQFQTTRGDLFDYNQTGQNALLGAQAIAGSGPTGGGPDYTSLAYNQYLPPQMTEAQLQQTPGYQFTLDQGLKATQSAAAARGLGVSGSALKGAGTYATGLADKTYLDQFNVAQQRFGDVLNLNTAQQGNLQAQFGRYQSLATIGENAAAQTGAAGTSAASTGGNYLNQAGLAQAAGTTGVSNAVTGAANNYLAYNQLQQYLNPTTTGYGTSAAGTPGISAAGNPVMTGYAPAITPGTNYLGFQG